MKLVEVQLVARQDKGLKHSDLRNNQTGNLLTGSIKKVRYWSGKHSEKAGTLGNHQKNSEQKGIFLKRTSFF